MPQSPPDTRERLLDAAEQLFAENGFDGTSLRAITTSADANLEKLFLVVSTAAVFSPTVKDDFFRHLPNLLIVDGVGASKI